MRLGATELLILFAILVVLFGASRLPALGSSIGEAIRNFKKGFNEVSDATKDEPKRVNEGKDASASATPTKAKEHS
ncbi:MAG: Sec-independent protein translocase subunit TatA/TatB [Myxococcaceae bacterium]